MTGLQHELQDRILGSNAHIYVWNTDGHHRLPRARPTSCERCRTWSARRRAFSARDWFPRARETVPIQIKGIDPALEPQVTDIRNGMLTGSLDGAGRGRRRRAGRHPSRQGSRDQARRRRRRFGVAAHAAGDAVADGHDSASRAACVSPASSASACTSSIRATASSRSTSRSGCSTRISVDFIQLRVDDIWTAPQVGEVDHRSSSVRST